MSKFGVPNALDWTNKGALGFAYPQSMGKLSVKTEMTLRQLRSLPGLRSMVEIREDGAIAVQRGAPDEDLADATPNFIRIGKMLGRSLQLDDLVELRVVSETEAATFASSGDRRVGVIHENELARLLETNHGA